MFIYDENDFNIDLFLEDIKKVDLSILEHRINDILTYQNWHDKSMTKGTNYFTNYIELKYYRLKDIEEVSYDSIFSHFKEMYEWFLDDEEYENLVNKLINVFLGYDSYHEVENYKDYIYKNSEINIPKCIIQKPTKKIVRKKELKKEVSPKKVSPKSEISLSKCEVLLSNKEPSPITNSKNIQINPEDQKIINLKNMLLEMIDKNSEIECIHIIQNIFKLKNKNQHELKPIVDKYIKKHDDIKFIKNHLINDIKIEITKYLKFFYKNNTSHAENISDENLIITYMENISKKCTKCNQLKLKYNFDTDKFKRDGYKSICITCNN